MNQLMNWHFTVQKGMYFDNKIQINKCEVFTSDIIEDGFWNYAYIPSEIELESTLDDIEQLFREAKRQPCFYIADSNDNNTKIQLLEGNGYRLFSKESFMTYTNKNTIIPIPSIKSLKIKRVIETSMRKDFVEVFTSAYGGEITPEQPYGELDKSYMDALVRSFKGINKFFHFICYDKNIPVSIATLCFSDGKGGIYNVGTVPTHRGKGYGTAVSNACIREWSNMGGDLLFLQTEKGSSVEKWYSSLGFKLEFVGMIYCKE